MASRIDDYLHRQADIGDNRLGEDVDARIECLSDTGEVAIYDPPCPFELGSDAKKTQIEKCGGPGGVMEQYQLLLKRSWRLVHYFRNNVGDDILEWPTSFIHNSEEAWDTMENLMKDLEASVGLLRPDA